MLMRNYLNWRFRLRQLHHTIYVTKRRRAGIFGIAVTDRPD